MPKLAKNNPIDPQESLLLKAVRIIPKQVISKLTRLRVLRPKRLPRRMRLNMPKNTPLKIPVIAQFIYSSSAGQR